MAPKQKNSSKQTSLQNELPVASMDFMRNIDMFDLVNSYSAFPIMVHTYNGITLPVGYPTEAISVKTIRVRMLKMATHCDFRRE